jgi:hypothetical protein
MTAPRITRKVGLGIEAIPTIQSTNAVKSTSELTNM